MTRDKTWCSHAVVGATPQRLIDTLTDTDACRRWSPVPFRLEGGTDGHLRPNTTTQVSGRLVGLAVRFELSILAADPARLLLRATGPVEIRVDYAIRPAPAGCAVDAAVSVRALDRRAGQLFARATGLLLESGTLDHTLRRIAHEAERAPTSSAAGKADAHGRPPRRTPTGRTRHPRSQ